MEFVLIRKGNFYMGNPSPRADSLGRETRHLVTITRDYWLSRTEVTREQWEKVMGNVETHPEKPSPYSHDNPKYPVVSKSFNEAEDFLQKLEKLSPGNRFRLPTEAEWEYACRAGTVTSFSTGTKISSTQANFLDESPSPFSDTKKSAGHPVPVGSYPANQWGLYDMHGNVWEWVSDWYAPFTSDQAIDPKGPENGTVKVIRGGSWYFTSDNAQSHSRRTHSPELWGFSIGFRIVRE